MNYLMAKTRGRRNGTYVVMTQEDAIYDVPEFARTRAYVDDYKLEDDEWFVIDNFSQQDYCLDLLTTEFDNTAYSNLPRNGYPHLAYLFAVQDNMFCFQKIVVSTVLNKKLLDFRIDQEPTILNCDYTVVLNKEADGYYNKATDKFYFKKLSDVTSIFTGISELYNEATDADTSGFMGLDILNIAEGYSVADVKTANRRRIKAAMDRYNNFDEDQKAQISGYLSQYIDDVPFVDGKFNISGEEDLTKILNCLNQRYYTTEIDGEKRLANSVTPIVRP